MSGRLLAGSVLLVVGGIVSVGFGLYGPAMVLFVAAGALALARVARRQASAQAPVAPVAVPPEEAELAEGPVWCCMRCGSIHMRQPRVAEGLIPGVGETLSWICARCKWRGQPLEFESATAYRQFVKALHPEEGARREAPRGES